MTTFIHKLPRRVAWILVALAILLSCGWIVQGSNSFQSCLEGDSERFDNAAFIRAAAAEATSPNDVQCLGDFLDANEPTLVALATIVVAGFTATLWTATRKMQAATERLARSADQTAQRQLRAYVSGTPEVLFSFDESHPPRFQLRIHNSGATPANEVRHRMKMAALPSGEVPSTSTSGDFSAPYVLFPNWEMRVASENKAPFDQTTIALLRDGSSRLYCYGDIEYLDVFLHPHTTRFCHEVYADRETLLRLTSIGGPQDFKVEFRMAPSGNVAT